MVHAVDVCRPDGCRRTLYRSRAAGLPDFKLPSTPPGITRRRATADQAPAMGTKQELPTMHRQSELPQKLLS
jgi:hypothetical protein